MVTTRSSRAQPDDSGPSLPRLNRGRLSRLASDTLLSRIVRGVWKPGDRLPSERRLSEQLGMSRASVREAIRGLEAMGLVDVRHGQGAFVREASDGSGGDAFFAHWQRDHTYSIGEILAFRLLVEPELAGLAAEKADGPFVGALTATMTAMEEAVREGDVPALVRLDTEFHDAITGRAGNRLYRDLLDHVAQLLIDSRHISLAVPGRATRVIASHNRVVEAIRARDALGAARAMRDHLHQFSSDMHVHAVGRSSSRGDV